MVHREFKSEREGLYSLYPLDQIPRIEPEEVGMAAMRLSQLVVESAPILPTAVIPTQALTLYLEKIVWQSPLLRDFPNLNLHLNVEQYEPLQAIAQSIQAGFQATPLPDAWLQDWLKPLANWEIAPPGLEAAASEQACLWLTPSLWLPPHWQDQYTAVEDLLLPQACWLQPQALALGVAQVWSQLYQAASLYLWAQLQIPLEQVKLGVMVQPLSATAASGWLHATATDRWVQATAGLPLSVLLGEAQPDLYHLNRVTGQQQLTRGHQVYGYQRSEQSRLSSEPDPSFELNPCITGVLYPSESPTAVLAPAVVARMMQWVPVDRSTEETLTLAWTMPQGTDSILIQGVVGQLPWPLSAFERLPSPPIVSSEEPPTRLEPSPSSSICLAQGLPSTPGQVIAPAMVTDKLQEHSLEVVAGKILVVPTCQPDDLPWLQQAVGIICETGGLTSHGAILARELGMPAIVGYSEATAQIQTGELIGLDGYYGTVYQLSHQGIPLPQPEQRDPIVGNEQDGPLKTQIWVTLSHAQALEQGPTASVDGLGLLRGEWLMLTALDRKHPQWWIEHNQHQQLTAQLMTHLRPFVAHFSPRPVFYRSLDGRSNELAALDGGEHWETPGPNPMLGLRGTARYMTATEVFNCELAALAHLCAEGYSNVRLLLPFVRSVDEFLWCKTQVEAAGLLDISGFQVWVMAEVPSILFLLPEYVAAGVQGVAIGSNDFTQLMLGVDREQSMLADRFDASHPAVVRAMAQLVRQAKDLGIPCSICGQAPVQYPQLIPQLIEWGITAITVDLQAVAATRQRVAVAERQQFFQALREHSLGLDAKTEDGLR